MGLNNELRRGKIYVIISFDYITVKIFHHIFENTKNSNNGDFFRIYGICVLKLLEIIIPWLLQSETFICNLYRIFYKVAQCFFSWIFYFHFCGFLFLLSQANNSHKEVRHTDLLPLVRHQKLIVFFQFVFTKSEFIIKHFYASLLKITFSFYFTIFILES